MKYLKIVALGVLTILLSSSSCEGKKTDKSKQGDSSKPTSKKEFKIPEIPSMITAPEERAGFLANNYWNNFDFADSTYVSGDDTEQIFVNYLDIIVHATVDDRKQGLNKLLDSAMNADSTAFARFFDLSEKYLYDANSPLRNEEMLIPILEYTTSSAKIGAVDKIRPKYMLDMALKNRAGSIATDFAYLTDKGATGQMHAISADYTILFFNNPGCHECRRSKKYIETSGIYETALNAKSTAGNKNRVAILAVYIDQNVEEWKSEPYPSNWINARDPKATIKNKELYDLKAIPTIYVLDSEKRIILKDPTVEAIESWLVANVN